MTQRMVDKMEWWRFRCIPTDPTESVDTDGDGVEITQTFEGPNDRWILMELG